MDIKSEKICQENREITKCSGDSSFVCFGILLLYMFEKVTPMHVLIHILKILDTSQHL